MIPLVRSANLEGLMVSGMITSVLYMSAKSLFLRFALIASACLLLTGTVSATGIQATMGDTVPLSGYSPTSISVYLFLTGPNLPVNGVALNDITRRADEGGFTVVSVDGSDDSWSYNWHTSSINGRLDDGTYTVWVVNGPNDRSNLANAEYGTISVTFGKPVITAGVSGSLSAAATSRPGSLAVSSEPSDASVVVGGQYRGKTPLTVSNLDPGTYAVTVSKFGYTAYSGSVTIGSGEEALITATLPAERGTLVVNTTPPGAKISVDGTAAGVSPLTLVNVLPGNHTITAMKEGYLIAETQTAVAAGVTSPVTLTLPPSSPLPGIPLKTPGLLQATLAALAAAASVAVYCRPRIP